MRRRRNQSKNTIVLLLFLIIIGIGIAYAVLTETLTINNTVSYDAMKWDVGFTSAEDGFDKYLDEYVDFMIAEYGSVETLGFASKEELKEVMREEVIYAPSTVTISEDKKSVTFNCELQMTTSEQLCVLSATITNNGTFHVAFTEDPTFTYDEKYIAFTSPIWSSQSIYGLETPVSKGQTIGAGESVTMYIGIRTNELTKDTLPSSQLSVPITVDIDFEESDYSASELTMLTTKKYNKFFWSETYQENIKNITFDDSINIPDNAIENWDVSYGKNGKVMSYIVFNENDSNYYDLHIQSNEQLYANFDMSNWFQGFRNVDAINGLELLDTGYTIDMSRMFEYTGYNSTSFTLDVSCFDTSKVTDMNRMFYSTGYNSSNFTLDVSNFDTKNVTNAAYMFNCVGYNSPTLVLDVSGFNTSSMVSMESMFSSAGYSNPTFTLDVSNFDTSKVDDWCNMFDSTGYNSNKFVTEITIRNPNYWRIYNMFSNAAVQPGSKITVNYTSETSDLVDQMIATKSANSNVVKGVQVD